ncbi:hypothetical protein PROFUN_03832 [Planoprotostelium fungivorum]|uniref:Uncharacterized protein n=1 Tax=Planoprotostelium fungivorum TaxID=1890364 RepID=A0A2P6NIB3_9EUKA|nr:hypothetical protein PROFUN_03832 [Planoprotostelium fungivorum]
MSSQEKATGLDNSQVEVKEDKVTNDYLEAYVAPKTSGAAGTDEKHFTKQAEEMVPFQNEKKTSD